MQMVIYPDHKSNVCHVKIFRISAELNLSQSYPEFSGVDDLSTVLWSQETTSETIQRSVKGNI